MTITALWSFSPDVVQVVLAIAAIVSIIVAWIAGRAGKVSSRRWMMAGAMLVAALIGYSLVVTWLFATAPAAT